MLCALFVAAGAGVPVVRGKDLLDTQSADRQVNFCCFFFKKKTQLRALGFRWSVEKTCWTHNLQSVMEAVGVGVAEDLTVEMCTAVGEQLRASGDSAAAAAAAGRQKPEMRVVGDEVQVSHSTRRMH